MLKNKKLIIGFITYNNLTAKYLPYFLNSLKEQTFKEFKILAIDNSEIEENDNKKFIREYYNEIEFEWAGKNLGFSRAYNKIINKAVDNQAKYLLIINPDVILEKDTLEKMIKELDNNVNIYSACPKILKWNFEGNSKTNIIDTCGIILKKGLKFFDLGQGEIDRGQFSNIDILGPSGACALYKIDALKKIEKKGGYFDELMFMYKEDCDLAYRLNLVGYKSKCINNAIAYHDRTVNAKGESDIKIAINRKNKSRQQKKWSFLNQYIIYTKYWSIQNWQNKLAILYYGFKMFIFVLLFEQYLLKEYIKLFEIRNEIIKYKK